MRLSKTLIPTLKEAPAEAEIPSHILMVRGGYLRKVAAGVYSFLPLGWRVIQKTFQDPDSDPERGPGRGRNPVSYPDGTRRLPAQGGRRRVLVLAARLAGHPEDIPHHPRGNEPGGRAGGLPAGGHSRRAVARVGALGPVRRAAPALQGPQGRGLRHRPDARRSHRRSGARRRAQLPAAAAQPVPDPVQVSRRAARAGGPHARPRVHHEGRLFVPRHRRRREARVPEHVRRVHAHLPALRVGVPRGRGRHRRHRRLAFARVPGADRNRRGRPAGLRPLRLRGQRRGGQVAPAGGRDAVGRRPWRRWRRRASAPSRR